MLSSSKPVDFIDSRQGSIALAAIRVSRGDRVVLRDVSVILKERRIGLVGLNGSGKSTFVRLFNGLLTPDTGRIDLWGVDVGANAQEAARRVGFVFQNPDHQIIFPTVAEDIAFSLLQMGVRKADARDRALSILARYNCADWADRPIGELSEGQKHLVCILAVLVANPWVLVLDEPFSSLDLAIRARLMRLIRDLPQQVVMISHDLDVYDGFDRILWLDDGRIRADGAPEGVLPEFRRHAAKKGAELEPHAL